MPGQRWVSNSESELGLGIVVSTENRRVELFFPAVEESRTYASDNAPLSRIVFAEGERMEVNTGEILVIIDSIEQQGTLIYHCKDDTGEEFVVPEQRIASDVHFTKPWQRLYAGQIDRHGFYKLRVKTQAALNRLNSSPVRGLLGARVQLLPHQFHIAYQLSKVDQPRALLADEVGLGKTIEACLVVHQRMITERAKRVLIVVPDNLQHQWLVELRRRFNLRFSLYTEARLQQDMIDSGHLNPFENVQLALVPLSLLTLNESALACVQEAGWDMLVVDEAHHLGWSAEQVSHAYSVIESLCHTIKSVLLLTATPEHLGPEGHFARLRLLDPQRFDQLDTYLAQRQQFEAVSKLLDQLEISGINGLKGDDGLRQAVVDLLGEDQIKSIEELSGDKQRAFDELLETLVVTQGPGRTLYRNTRENVAGFPNRQLFRYPLAVDSDYLQLASESPLDQQLRPECVFGSQWLVDDPRVAWLIEWLKSNKKRKALLICHSAQTAIELEHYLNIKQGIRCAAFHEQMSLVNRDRAAAYFADVDLGAQVLVCSEIGSEGRNFQFASDLILFDLPVNPDLLEQRIGRLDRIGQLNDVSIHVPFIDSSAASVLLEWFDQGLEAFTRVSKVGDALYRSLASELATYMQTPSLEGLSSFIQETVTQRKEMELRLTQGRDRLLELNSQPSPTQVDLIESVLDIECQDELRFYAETLFDHFGLEMQPRDERCWVISPGEEMVAPLTTLPEEGMTLTFEREEALKRDEIEFMSWEHPLLIELMELIQNSQFGNAALCSLNLPALPVGTVMVESFYRAHISAPKALQVERFFDQALLRFLMDANGNNLASVLPLEKLNPLAQPVSRNTSQKMLRLVRPSIEAQLKSAEVLVEGERETLKQTAMDKFKSEFSQRRQTLNVLAEQGSVDAIKELKLLEDQAVAIERALSRVELVSDAVRVIVIGEQK